MLTFFILINFFIILAIQESFNQMNYIIILYSYLILYLFRYQI